MLCTGACNSFWSPLRVRAGSPTGQSVTGKLGVVKRPDGARQVTYDGRPLYSFSEDKRGQVTGDGFADAFGGRQFTWHVVKDTGVSSSPAGGGTGGY